MILFFCRSFKAIINVRTQDMNCCTLAFVYPGIRRSEWYKSPLRIILFEREVLLVELLVSRNMLFKH